MSQKVDLKVDWCSHEAAKYAVEHWHYSKICPTGKQNMFGVWENGSFIGCVLYRNGAKDLGSPYGLNQFQVTELSRVALSEHLSTVTRIIKISMILLKAKNNKLRLIVSFADPFVGHNGGIYQGGNWIYTGTSGDTQEFCHRGKWYHSRDFRNSDWSSVSGMDYKKLKSRKRPGKHRYLMPLDKEMRKQIEPLRKPYPKRPTEAVA